MGLVDAGVFHLFVSSIYGALCIFVIAAHLGASHFLHYGKTLQLPPTDLSSSTSTSATPLSNSILRLPLRILTFKVPKLYFTHFYVVATTWTLFLIYSYLCALSDLNPAASFSRGSNGSQTTIFSIFTDVILNINPTQLRSISPLDTLLWWTLLFTHEFKRLLECLFVSKTSPHSKISLAMYLGAMAYYTITPFAVSLDGLGKLIDMKETHRRYEEPWSKCKFQ
jgi:hypothetical protein